MRLVLCALVMSGSLLGYGLAAAQSDDELAKRYYKLGEELYNRADYEGAYKQFQQAYELSKRPALLFNMARCQESLGQHEKAIELLTEYLSSNPDNRTVIEARIANLRRLVERKRKDQAPPPPATAPVETPPAAVPPPPPPPAAPEPQPRSRPLRLPGWIAVGTGGAVLVSGVALGVVARRKASDLEEANRTHQEYSTVKSTADTQRALRYAAIGTLVGGGVVAATGAVLLILDWRAGRTERSAWVAPTFSAEGAGLSGFLRF